MDNMQNPNEMPPQGAAAPMPTPPPASAPMPMPAPEPMAAPMPEPAAAPSGESMSNNVPPSSSAPEASSPNTGERRGMAALGYVGILCVIPLVFARDSAFAQYHAKQGLVLALAGLVLSIVRDFVWRAPFGGLLVLIVAIGLLVVSIMGIVKALDGKQFDIPYVSEWAKKFTF